MYLDNLATTAVDPQVVTKMSATLREHYGNPSSSTHAMGWSAAALVEEARGRVAALLDCDPVEIIFTSGATESNNLALRGMVAGREPGTIVTSNLEHDSVAEPLREIGKTGWRIREVACGSDGLVDPAAVEAAIDDQTLLVSIIAAQNEIGTVQPWPEIASICRDRGVFFHTDAAQACGKIRFSFARDGIDLLSLSGHKLYAPKGVGALCVRRGRPRVAPAPQITGGGQQRGIRAGTLNVPGIVGLGEACRLANERLEDDVRDLRVMGTLLYTRIAREVGDVQLRGDALKRLPGTLNLGFPGIGAADLLGELPTLALSTGSACSSAKAEVSRVLLALGLDESEASGSLRIGFGRNNTREEAEYAARMIIDAVHRLRSRA